MKACPEWRSSLFFHSIWLSTLPNFRSFPGTRRYEKSPLGGLGRLNACPTNSTPGLVKVSELSVGQAIPPDSSLASEVFIPISKKLKGIPDEVSSGFQPWPKQLNPTPNRTVAISEWPDQHVPIRLHSVLHYPAIATYLGKRPSTLCPPNT